MPAPSRACTAVAPTMTPHANVNTGKLAVTAPMACCVRITTATLALKHNGTSGTPTMETSARAGGKTVVTKGLCMHAAAVRIDAVADPVAISATVAAIPQKRIMFF